jgi:hypothetical protein
MTEFRIQIHLHRSPDSGLANLLSQFQHLSAEKGWIRLQSVKRGFDEHTYVNVTFETDYPKLFWQLLYEQFYQESASGQLMRAASIAICEGRRGWDDYLSLYHFDTGLSSEHFSE